MKTTSIFSDLVESYNHHAAEREKIVLSDWKITERQRFLDLVKLTGKTSLLDLGAGPGQHSLFFQERGLEMVSIDLSFEMCRLNREKGIAVAQMNLCQFGLKPDAFGAVWSLNCLLHLPKNEMPGVLENIRDILVPEGIFFWDFTAGKILKAFGQMILINPGVFFHSSPIRKFRYL